MKISIVVPTYRIGGFDVMINSLERQTYRDFELIIADEIWEQRNPIVKDKFQNCSFPVHHLKPEGGPRLSNYSRSINNAVVRASGDLIMMQADYTFFPPECLERHVEVHELSSKKICLMLDVHNTELAPLDDYFYQKRDPNLNHGFRDFGVKFGPNWEDVPYPTPEDRAVMESLMNEAADLYEQELKCGNLDRFMWSIFSTPVTNVYGKPGIDAVRCFRILETLRSHVKSNVPEVDPNWCSLKNETIPTEAFLKANGLDEDFDGCHLYQDQEFAWRLHRLGYEWSKAEGGEAYIVNPRSILYSKRLSRPMTDRGAHDGTSNQEMMHRKQQTGEPVNPQRNLRIEREAYLERAL